MSVNIASLHARLLNISREKKIELQILFNRLAAEQFLYRLSVSPYADKFIFKGGSLLTYLIESDRKTKDLDFSIKQISNQVDDVVRIIQAVLDIPVDDGIVWSKIAGAPLLHPDMDYPGVRMVCHFLFGKVKGIVRIDMAIGDVVEPIRMPLERLRYRSEPIFGESFSLLVYPPETVFAEKLQIALKKRGQNTRMKDYYDLVKLIEHNLDRKKLKKTIEEVFLNREMPQARNIQFEEADLLRLQTYWEHFLKREKMDAAPARITEVIDKVNAYLKALYAR